MLWSYVFIHCIHPLSFLNVSVANHLFCPFSDLEDKREVSKEAGEELAKKWGVPFFECSAYTETNLRELWVEAVRLARNIEEDAQFQRQKTEDHKDDEKSSFCKECLCGGGRSSKWNADGTMKKATDDIQFFGMKY